ncbi:hypothetical protein SAMN04489712_11626 [Thermomonospora echinospora]|uniref:L-tyrosine 3-hydroxylase n=1 Tax=Thermomonospora echinospora TaxID=1992 RepID=A0A1H6DET5_9ACTN|nr:hypothetical protein [Thermomonospora echinospora]SEG83572.1 hypothetical protein SAMN04489712_11626 [Thermomonospora echinospora]
MTTRTETRPARAVGDWDFGDVPYSLEPLVLPDPSAPASPPRTGTRVMGVPHRDLDADRRRLRALADPRGRAGLGAPAESSDRLYWFRWITGHQATFVLWHLMGRLMGGRGGAAETAGLETYTRGYCAMLLYTGSCPREVYEGLIRPSMFLQHPGFSGTWAPDFTAVRPLFRGRDLPWTSTPEAAGLRAAVELNNLIHDGVAARLVPSGRSLLQESMKAAPVRRSEKTDVIYDNYFVTLRGPVAGRAVAGQLLHRLRAVSLDVAVNGLHPHEDPDRPAELRRPEVLACERDLFSILARVGDLAAGTAEAEPSTEEGASRCVTE